MIKNIYKCDDCENTVKNVNGKLVCLSCGLMQSHAVFVPDLFYLLSRNKKVKSVHKRNRWFMKKIRPIVSGLAVGHLTDDFIKVVKILVEEKLINKNVSRYNYYILRLCSKNAIKLKEKISDMKEGLTKDRFDNNLFGIVYKKLQWENIAKENCKYYRLWKKRRYC